jgi:hypothetical protein
VTLSRKGAKSRRRIAGLRSKTTKARTHDDRLRAANADLKKKLAEALEQQIATSEVLRVISSSPRELEPVFQTILENAVRVCGAKFATFGCAMATTSVSLRRTVHRPHTAISYAGNPWSAPTRN